MKATDMTGLAILLSHCVSFGILLALFSLRRMDLEGRFFRTNGIIALVLLALGYYLLRASGVNALLEGWGYWFLFLLLFVYVSLVFWLPVLVERTLLLGMGLWIAIKTWSVLAWSDHGSVFLFLDFISVLTGGILIGLALVAMNVGHSYLNSVRLSMRPLRQASLGLIGFLIFRWIWVMIVPLVLVWTNGEARADFSQFFQIHEVFNISIALARVLFGLVAPIPLLYMTWETVKMESTQSATGILYPLLVLFVVGETTALFITVSTALPV